MNVDQDWTIDLMRKMRTLHEQGSRDDAQALYRRLAPSLDALEQRNLWDGDFAKTSQAIDLILWMITKEDLPPFRNDWPTWLSDWIITLQRPVQVLPPLRLLRKSESVSITQSNQ